MKWIPSKWRIEGATDRLREVTIESVGQIEGPDLYAIRQSGSVMAKDGEWEYEPIPSSRDDDFFSRCRYATFAEAAATYARFANNPAQTRHD